MKLIRGLLYVTVGVAVGIVLKRFLRDSEAEPQPETGSPPPPAKEPKPTSPPETADEIPVVDLADTEADTKEADPPKSSPADDLTSINGIGPTYAKRLQAAGIMTFAALAEQEPERVREIAQIKEWQAADPADWVAEAQARAGDNT